MSRFPGAAMKWFKHMSDAGDDPFIAGLVDEFGLEGLARWWLVLETIAKNMDDASTCSVTLPWTKWQTVLHGKRKKLESFLRYCEDESKLFLVVHENKAGTKRKQNENKLEIGCYNLLKLRDNHNRNLQAQRERERQSKKDTINAGASQAAESPPADDRPTDPERADSQANEPAPPDDETAGRSPPLEPAQSDGMAMAPGGWQPGKPQRDALRMAGVMVAIEPEDVAAFTTHYGGRWMRHDEIHRKFVNWMIRKKQYGAQRSARGHGYGRQQRTRTAAFAAAVGDPFEFD